MLQRDRESLMIIKIYAILHIPTYKIGNAPPRDARNRNSRHGVLVNKVCIKRKKS